MYYKCISAFILNSAVFLSFLILYLASNCVLQNKDACCCMFVEAVTGKYSLIQVGRSVKDLSFLPVACMQLCMHWVLVHLSHLYSDRGADISYCIEIHRENGVWHQIPEQWKWAELEILRSSRAEGRRMYMGEERQMGERCAAMSICPFYFHDNFWPKLGFFFIHALWPLLSCSLLASNFSSFHQS